MNRHNYSGKDITIYRKDTTLYRKGTTLYEQTYCSRKDTTLCGNK